MLRNSKANVSIQEVSVQTKLQPKRFMTRVSFCGQLVEMLAMDYGII